ncbi:hypothetical protein KCP71_03330 [Salmonella enterica subsp. enterica]|nr:hypothetical protein KCP71_03330 [Salmonella enterica subsp. enterica]
MYVLCCIAALAGLMLGYSTAVITGVVLPLQHTSTDANRDRMGCFQYRGLGRIIGALVGENCR